MRSPLTKIAQAMTATVILTLTVIVIDLQQGRKTSPVIWWVALGGSALSSLVVLWGDVITMERIALGLSQNPEPQKQLSKVARQPEMRQQQHGRSTQGAKHFSMPPNPTELSAPIVFNPQDFEPEDVWGEEDKPELKKADEYDFFPSFGGSR